MKLAPWLVCSSLKTFGLLSKRLLESLCRKYHIFNHVCTHVLLNLFCVNLAVQRHLAFNPELASLYTCNCSLSLLSDWNLNKKCTRKNSSGKVLEVLIRRERMLLPSLALTRLTDPLLPLPYPSAAACEILHHRCSGDLGFAGGFFHSLFLPIASLLFKEPRLTRRFYFLQRLV